MKMMREAKNLGMGCRECGYYCQRGRPPERLERFMMKAWGRSEETEAEEGARWVEGWGS